METLTKSKDLYFERCHQQPIWLFNESDVEDWNAVPNELTFSLLTLTSRFLPGNNQSVSSYLTNARSLVMMRIADGNVDIATIESLCLLSYSFFLGMC